LGKSKNRRAKKKEKINTKERTERKE